MPARLTRALAALALLAVVPVTHAALLDDTMTPIAHTFSIVARDAKTGEMGVAVQSHYFSVGPIVPWAEAGVGVVATQSLVLVDYGPDGLALMKQGLTAQQALDSLLKADAHNEGRQVAMLDATGNVAAYTGKACIPDAGHVTGSQFSCQANLMANDKVWPAMKDAYIRAEGDLAERMMQALEAAQAAGGDIRGRQSAAMVVVKAKSTGKPWADRVIDLRVEDSPEPLKELRRLITLRRAYNLEDAGDNLTVEKKSAEAAEAYAAAARLAPDVVEMQFWAAVSMYPNGPRAEALRIFRDVFHKELRWAALVPRLAKVGLFPDEPRALAEVAAQAPEKGAW